MKKIAFFVILVIVIITSGCVRSLNPLSTYEDFVLDDRIIGAWENQSDEYDDVLPDRIEIGRTCRPIYEEYDLYTNAEGKLDSNHNIISKSLISSEEFESNEFENLNFKELDSLSYYYITFKQVEEINGIETVQGVYFKLALTELNGLVFFDLLHKEDPQAFNDMTGYNIPAHYIGIIDISQDKINFRLLDTDEITSLIKNRRVRLKNQQLEGEGYQGKGEIILTASTDELRSFLGKYGTQEKLFSESITYNRHD